MEAVEMVISGRVQGVGFRYFTLQVATELGIDGWVRNEPDGTVRCQAAGPPEAMAAFRDRLRKGPVFGRTDHIEEHPLSEAEGTSLHGFDIHR